MSKAGVFLGDLQTPGSLYVDSSIRFLNGFFYTAGNTCLADEQCPIGDHGKQVRLQV